MTVAIELKIELGPEEHAERDKIKPEEKCDSGAERAIHLRVVRKARDIPPEGECREKPQTSCCDGSGEYAPPRLSDGCPHVVDQRNKAYRTC